MSSINDLDKKFEEGELSSIELAIWWLADANSQQQALDELDELRSENERLKADIDEISGCISSFKKARNTTRSIDAISKIVVWNVEHEDRLAKNAREDAE